MKNKLIGRSSEEAILQQLLDSHQAEFLALYGRRRVGKTFLIRKFFEKASVIFFNVTGAKSAPMTEQLRHFTQQVSTVFHSNAKLAMPENWDAAFELLTDAINNTPKNKKIVLFFDEFPWLVTKNSRLLETLDYYWNQHWSNHERLKLIICGSSASWIIKKIIRNRAGLHNRITRKIRLEPFSLAHTQQFLHARGIRLNQRHILTLYMVMGGIPYYLSQIPKGLSAAQIIELLAFRKDSFLLDEFDNLFPALFDNHESYVEILKHIAGNRAGIGLSELLKLLPPEQRGKQGVEKLSALEESGFIRSFKSHFNKRRGISYRLIDEYTLFYLNWLAPLKDTQQAHALAEGNWQAIQSTSKWHSWQGYAFEAICYKHINCIRKKLDISPAAIANTWRYVPTAKSQQNGAQIDLLFDRPDETITLCEIKYTGQPFLLDKAYANNLINKRDVFVQRTRTKKHIFIALISASGIKNTWYADALIDGVVTLEELFE